MDGSNASEFKARCLALLDHVNLARESSTALKRGHPVGQLAPSLLPEAGHPQDELRGSVQVLGDIESPVLPPSAWEAESGHQSSLREIATLVSLRRFACEAPVAVGPLSVRYV